MYSLDMHVRLPKLSRRFGVAAIVAAVLLVAGGVAIYQLRKPSVRIPDTVTKAVTFPIYIPEQLPSGYTLDEQSFKYVAGEQVLVFQATDEAGDTLVFSQQAKPANINFSEFAQKQLINAKKLPNVPHPTTVGKTLDRQTTLVSIVTSKTWIIMTTQVELDNQQFRDLSVSLRQY
jgi:hypothetical protein